MSRVGKTPIQILSGVTVTTVENKISVTGPKGSLELDIPEGFSVITDDNQITVKNEIQTRRSGAIHGLVRAQIQNMILGVDKGWEKVLELSGVGYKANVEGNKILLSVGFSHQVELEVPKDIAAAVKEGKIVITGIDRQKVGQFAANIRQIKKPEPYKGKGIKYLGEKIRKKAGKAAKAIGSA